MIIKLQSNSVFMELGELDTDTGEISVVKKADAAVSTDGNFEIVSGDILAIYAENEKIYGIISNNIFEINERSQAVIRPAEGDNILSISHDGIVIIEYRYTPPSTDESDDTPFVDGEDLDFCIFMKNIINSPERQSLFV